MFAFQDTHGLVEIAFTDRHGGHSGGPFASLDLAARSDDPAGTVGRNRRTLLEAFAPEDPAARLVGMRQVHGADVHVVDEASRATAPDEQDPVAGQEPVADALVTRLPGVVLMVRVADCVPVVLTDPEAGVVGVAHAGRSGMVAGVVPSVVRVMREHGAERLTAWIGPHVCGACYEVPAALRAEVAAVVPASYASTAWGTPSLDVGAGVRAQLLEAGVAVFDASRCTLEDPDLYSFRRQGASSGRMAGLVRRRG